MRFCTNCGTQLSDMAAFCQKCGQKVNIATCPFCGKEVDDDAGFCVHCGKPLHESQDVKTVQRCPSCGEENADDTDFCIHCGNPFSNMREIPEEMAETPEPPPPQVSEDSADSAASAVELANENAAIPEPPQSEDHELQWSWSYKRVRGWFSSQRFTESFTVSLGEKALHITEKVEYRGKNTVNEKEIQLQNITGTSLKEKASVFLWLISSFFSLLILSLPILYFMGKIPNQSGLGTAALSLVFLIVCMCYFINYLFFQIYHNELWIIETDGSKTVMQGGRQELLKEIESRIALHTGSNTTRITRTQSGATGRISLSVTVAAVTVILLLISLCGSDSSNERKSAAMANSAAEQEKNTIDASGSPRNDPSKTSDNSETQDAVSDFKVDMPGNAEQEKDTSAAPEKPLQTGTNSEYAAIYADLVRQIAAEDDNEWARFSLIDFNGDDIPELVTFNSTLSLYTYDRNNLFTIIDNWTSGWVWKGEMQYLPGKNMIRNVVYVEPEQYRTYYTTDENYNLLEITYEQQNAAYGFITLEGSSTAEEIISRLQEVDPSIESLPRYGVTVLDTVATLDDLVGVWGEIRPHTALPEPVYIGYEGEMKRVAYALLTEYDYSVELYETDEPNVFYCVESGYYASGSTGAPNYDGTIRFSEEKYESDSYTIKKLEISITNYYNDGPDVELLCVELGSEFFPPNPLYVG